MPAKMLHISSKSRTVPNFFAPVASNAKFHESVHD